MTDRELLKKAAKAAGLYSQGDETSHYGHFIGLSIRGDDNPSGYRWNPLTDDGDALRLAVKVLNWPHGGRAFDNAVCAMLAVGQLPADPYAATRRAIVRAAAALWESRP